MGTALGRGAGLGGCEGQAGAGPGPGPGAARDRPGVRAVLGGPGGQAGRDVQVKFGVWSVGRVMGCRPGAGGGNRGWGGRVLRGQRDAWGHGRSAGRAGEGFGVCGAGGVVVYGTWPMGA